MREREQQSDSERESKREREREQERERARERERERDRVSTAERTVERMKKLQLMDVRVVFVSWLDYRKKKCFSRERASRWFWLWYIWT